MNIPVKFIIISFSALWGCSVIVIIASNHFILTPEFFISNHQSLASSLSQNMTLFEQMQHWSYIYQGVYCLIKVFLISSVIHTAMYFQDHPVSFRQVVFTVILSEFIFVLQAVGKVIWFCYRYPSGTLLDWHQTYLFSVTAFFDHIPANWIYPLATVNLFEFIYWFLLAFGISKSSKLNFDHTLTIIVRSYVPALILWVLGVCFCSVILFPSHS